MCKIVKDKDKKKDENFKTGDAFVALEKIEGISREDFKGPNFLYTLKSFFGLKFTFSNKTDSISIQFILEMRSILY